MYFLSSHTRSLITQSSILIFCVCIIYIIFDTLLYILALSYFSFASLYIVVYLLTHIANQCIMHTFYILYDPVVHHNIYITFTHIMFALQCFVVVRIIHVMSILYSNSIINHKGSQNSYLYVHWIFDFK